MRRLLSLLTSGNTDGQRPVGDDLEPWLLDGEAQAIAMDDTTTAARIDWQAAGITQEVAP